MILPCKAGERAEATAKKMALCEEGQGGEEPGRQISLGQQRFSLCQKIRHDRICRAGRTGNRGSGGPNEKGKDQKKTHALRTK